MCFKSDSIRLYVIHGRLMHDVLIIRQITSENVSQMLDKLYIKKSKLRCRLRLVRIPTVINLATQLYDS